MTDPPNREDYEKLLACQAEVMQSLVLAGEAPGLLRGSLQAMVRHLPLVAARIWGVHTDAGLLEIQASAGTESAGAGTTRVAIGSEFLVGRIARSGVAQIIESFSPEQDTLEPEWVRGQAITTFVGYPLLVEGKVEGVFTAFSQQPLGAGVLSMLQSLACAVGLAMIERRSRAVGREGQNRLRQQLVESEAKFKSIFDHMLDGYFSTVFVGNTRIFNPAAIRLLGYQNAAELESIDPRQLFADPHEFQALQEELSETGYLPSVRAKIRRKDGSLCVCEGSLKINRASSHAGPTVEALFHDVTEQVESEERIRTSQAVEAANKIKNEFLAKMSHEIRTPLNAMLGLAHLALHTPLSERQRDYLQKIQRSGQNLLLIVNDILDFSKVEAGKLELERVEMHLEEVLENLVATVAGKASEKGLEFLVSVSREVPGRLLGDPMRLGQVLINLVGNAIKFTTSGEVCLSVHRAEPLVDPNSPVRLHFLVRDSGIGLTHEQIRGLFVAFSQADSSTSRKYGGTGLGLAICDRLVRLMGGEIAVESQPEHGSTFSFTALFGGLEPEVPLSVPEVVGRKALVIEDHPLARASLVGLLRSLSIEVSEAASGNAAISQVEKADPPFDLVFLEQSLGGSVGAERWCQWLRSSTSTIIENTPVILVAEQGQGTLLDGQAILFKPVIRSRLTQILASLLGQPIEGELPAQTLAQASHLEGARVLLVEDNLINQQVARELLQSAGLQVDVVGDGQQAVDCLLSAPVGRWQLVLMDLQMPRLDGYAATEIIRADARLAELPIIAMTAHVLKEERVRCLDAGMNDFVAKPIDPENLVVTLQRWIPQTALGTPAMAWVELSFPAVEGINVQAGLRRVAGNAELYRSLLVDFAQQQQSVCDSLVAALELGDPVHFRLLAHTLKGVGANLGAEGLQQQAARLEDLASCARLEAARPLLPLLRSSYAELSQRVLQALADLPAPQPPRWSAEVPVQPLLEKLSEQLKSSDGAAVDTWLELSFRLQTLVPGLLLKAVGDPLQGFDFEAALQALPAVSRALLAGGLGDPENMRP